MSGAHGDSLKAEVSNDDGASWTLLEQRVSPNHGWAFTADLVVLLLPDALHDPEPHFYRVTAENGGGAS